MSNRSRRYDKRYLKIKPKKDNRKLKTKIFLAIHIHFCAKLNLIYK